jgi:hypothetical protein
MLLVRLLLIRVLVPARIGSPARANHHHHRQQQQQQQERIVRVLVKQHRRPHPAACRSLNPIQRWSMMMALKRDSADETLDRLIMLDDHDNRNHQHHSNHHHHRSMLDRQARRAAGKKQPISTTTVATGTTTIATTALLSDREQEILVRKRKSHSLKVRSVRGGTKQPLGRPKKQRPKLPRPPTHPNVDDTPRPPLDPVEAFQGAQLGPVEKQEIDATMFHDSAWSADNSNTAVTTNQVHRLIGAVMEHTTTTKQLPPRLQGPIIFESNQNIWILPNSAVHLQWRNDPTVVTKVVSPDDNYCHHDVADANQPAPPPQQPVT